MVQRSSGTILSVQYLRGIAALLVALHHATAVQDWLFNPVAGSTVGLAGVDIFFVISGFVMYVAAREETATQFIARRIVRVAPLYWLATFGFFGFLALGFFGGLNGFDYSRLWKSLLFIPHFHPEHPGFAWPVLIPGWTLNYEMFFYGLFALAILTRRIVPTLLLAIGALVLAGSLLHPTDAILSTYTSPMLLEFAAGLCLGRLYTRTRLAALWPLLLLGSVGIVVAGTAIPNHGLAVACRMIASVAVVAGILGLEDKGKVKSVQSLKFLGDASYSLYLSHTVTLVFVFTLWKHIHLSGWPQFLGMLLTALAASVAVGGVIHVLVERPLLKLLRPIAQPARPPAAISAAE